MQREPEPREDLEGSQPSKRSKQEAEEEKRVEAQRSETEQEGTGAQPRKRSKKASTKEEQAIERLAADV